MNPDVDNDIAHTLILMSNGYNKEVFIQPVTEFVPCRRGKLCDKEHMHIGGCNKKKSIQCLRSKYCNRGNKHCGSCNRKYEFYVNSDAESSDFESSDDELGNDESDNKRFESCSKHEIRERPKGHSGWCKLKTSNKNIMKPKNKIEKPKKKLVKPKNEIEQPKKKLVKPKNKIEKPKKKPIIIYYKKCTNCGTLSRIEFSNNFFNLCKDCTQQTKCIKNIMCASICDSNGSHYGVCRIRDYAEQIGKIVVTEKASSCMDGNSYHYIGRIVEYNDRKEEYVISWGKKFHTVTKVPSAIPEVDKMEIMDSVECCIIDR